MGQCQLSENILFHCTKHNFMDMQKPGPRGRSSSINPGPGAAVGAPHLLRLVFCKSVYEDY